MEFSKFNRVACLFVSLCSFLALENHDFISQIVSIVFLGWRPGLVSRALQVWDCPGSRYSALQASQALPRSRHWGEPLAARGGEVGGAGRRPWEEDASELDQASPILVQEAARKLWWWLFFWLTMMLIIFLLLNLAELSSWRVEIHNLASVHVEHCVPCSGRRSLLLVYILLSVNG